MILLPKSVVSKLWFFPLVMWELDYKKGYALKNWCFQTVMLEKTLESPLDSKEIIPVNPKRNQPWIFFRRTEAEAEAPVLWPPVGKIWLRKDPDAGKNWRQEEKGMTEDEMVGWHHWFNGHEFEQTQGDKEWRKPGVLQSMGSQRVGHDWATEQQLRVGLPDSHGPQDSPSSIHFLVWEDNLLSLPLVYFLCPQYSRICSRRYPIAGMNINEYPTYYSAFRP